MKTNSLFRLFLGLTFSLQLSTAFAQGTAFTYQGRLNDGGNPATGVYDLRFTVFDTLTGGNAVSGGVTNTATPVSDGLFAASVEFGTGVFTGPDLWLEIAVRTNGSSGAFTTLTPRQPLTATPYSVTAGNLTGNLPATQLTGKLASGQLSGVYSNAVAFTNAANSFVGGHAGNGNGLTAVNALTLGGLAPAALWQLGGNNVLATQFLGSTNNQALELRVNGDRALRLEPATNGAPNLIAGSPVNQVDVGVVGATISGGGAENYFGFTRSNRVSADFASIGGGFGNLNQSFGSVIGGGIVNQILDGGSYSGVAGGGRNLIEANTDEAFIAGGYGNSIQSYARDSAIGGGLFNTNGSSYSVIAGGQNNTIEPGTDSSSIGGGWLNFIQSGADQTVIAGGNANQILSGARESFVGGGYANVIQTNAAFSFIGAGTGNVIGTNSTWGAIAGGQNNLIQSNALFGSIGGGLNNLIVPGARYATIAGGEFNVAAYLSTVGGGQANVITNSASFGTIGGGVGNGIAGSVQYGTIGGGNANQISQFAHGSTIAGGWTNSILFNVQMGAIGGGKGNVIRNGGDYSFIGGGLINSNAGYVSAIAGGENNNIDSLADHSVIGGGGANQITGSQALPVYAIIAGGQNNSIKTNATYSTIGGGISNTVQAGAQFATIPGGASNSVAGRYTLASGHRAKALHDGAFVWADSIDADFASTVSNQFAVRASGGIRLETAGAGATIDGQQLLSGVVPSSSILGTYSSAVTFNNGVDAFSGSFTGDGTGLSNVNANAVGGLSSSNFWQLGGNTGNPYTVLGTRDDRPLMLYAGNQQALQLQGVTRSLGIFNYAASGNVIGGASVNSIYSGVLGGTIGGGGMNQQAIIVSTPYPNLVSDDFGTIAGGLNNTVGNTNSDLTDVRAGTIGGGETNRVTSTYGTIGGGFDNWIQASSDASTISGGRDNAIQNNSLMATISGGSQNQIQSGVVAATIGGGISNGILSASDSSTIAGGVGNAVASSSSGSTIGGGQGNGIKTSSTGSTIGGGAGNVVESSAPHSTIAGGENNHVTASDATVGGGSGNVNSGTFSAIGGGLSNHTIGLAATVPGGEYNTAAGQYSFAAGQQATAAHDGAFVWADSQNSGFASTANDQFSVRAAGGVQMIGAGLVSTGTGNGVYGVSSAGNGVQGTASASGVSGVYGENFAANAYGVAGRATGSGSAAIYGDSGGSAAWAGYFVGNVRVTGTINPPSDRNVKRDFETIDARAVLDKLSRIPINIWAYTNSPAVRHLGPVAQDFKAAFDLGADDKSIATVDADGVALAAIQGLNQKLEQELQARNTQIAGLENRNASLENRLTILERLVADMTANLRSP